MPVRTLIVAALFATACLDDDPELSEIEQAETVVDPPTPIAYCIEGCTPGHVVGEPVRVQTSFHGYCKQGWEYPCQAQSYNATFACDGVPCDVGAPSVSTNGFYKTWPVKPLAAGAMTIRVTFIGAQYGTPIKTFTLPAVSSYVPDAITARCTQATGAPCVVADNVGPVRIAFELYAGTTKLWPKGVWGLATTGTGHWSLGTVWNVTSVGDVTVTGQYNGLEATVALHIKVPPPPPPPPKPPLSDRLDAYELDDRSKLSTWSTSMP